MLSTILTLLQQQAARLSHVEQNQHTTPQAANNHDQNSLHNVLQGEISSQQHRTGQRITRTETNANMNGNNARFNNKIGVIEIQDAENVYGNRNGNNKNNRNGGRGGNSSGSESSDSGS
ncbi:hypothetical protein P8452_57673 [Trifolium repens]|nr:hypothetical protein P8452_57673 [Trifolium repens]